MPAPYAAPCCPRLDSLAVTALADRVVAESWLLAAVDAVAASGLPDAWVAAGAIRDVVWGQLHDGFDPSAVKDIDVAYFDPADLSQERDSSAEHVLRSLADRHWEATNQAAVHRWYHEYFGGEPMEAFVKRARRGRDVAGDRDLRGGAAHAGGDRGLRSPWAR